MVRFIVQIVDEDGEVIPQTIRCFRGSNADAAAIRDYDRQFNLTLYTTNRVQMYEMRGGRMVLLSMAEIREILYSVAE